MCVPRLIFIASAVLAPFIPAAAAQPVGDPDRGAAAFAQCAACHSVKAGEHLTGPSLARVWGRKAGTLEGFGRYSDALKNAEVVWNEEALDRWLTDPQAFIPNNLMTFPGVKDARARADLIAYLKAVSEGRGAPPARGMMARPMVDLKKADKSRQVAGIRYCRGTYHVTTEAGQTLPFWEFNIRFKTDSSKDGPPKGRPVLSPAGMMGDRAFIIFSSPEEISATIDRKC